MNHADLIKQIDFEISSICNAVCPVCPRRIDGRMTMFDQTYYSLAEVKRILDEGLLNNIDDFNICGNYGDGMANPEIVEIIEWIRDINPRCDISLKTNGGLGTQDQYKRLAELNVNIRFGIDGIGEKNELYRVNVKWNKLHENILAFSSCAKPAQISIQFLLWAETVDQIIPMIDYAKSISCGSLYLRKPYVAAPDYTEVFNVRNESIHFLTQIEHFDGLEQIMETWWKLSEYDILKKIVENLPLKVKKLKLSNRRIGLSCSERENEYKLNKSSEASEISHESEPVSVLTQTCLSKNGRNRLNIKENWYNIYITHDKLLMPCCMMPPFASAPDWNLGNHENSLKIEILKKMDEVGRDNFSLKNKSLREVMNSGALHKFIYDDLEKDKTLGFCKMICGRCG